MSRKEVVICDVCGEKMGSNVSIFGYLEFLQSVKINDYLGPGAHELKLKDVCHVCSEKIAICLKKIIKDAKKEEEETNNPCQDVKAGIKRVNELFSKEAADVVEKKAKEDEIEDWGKSLMEETCTYGEPSKEIKDKLRLEALKEALQVQIEKNETLESKNTCLSVINEVNLKRLK